MSDVNNITIEGRITKNAEMRMAGSSNVVSFSIANNKSIKQPDGTYKSAASYFDCEVWGKYAETMLKHLTKGRALTIVGELVQDRWEKDGKTNSRIKIKVNDMSLRWDKKEVTQSEMEEPKAEEEEKSPFEGDGIPF